MENIEPTINTIKKKARKTYLSLDKWIGKMKLAFGNARLVSIFPHLETVGYDDARITVLNNKLTNLIELNQGKVKANADKKAATETHFTYLKELNKEYIKHRSLLKILLGDDKLANTLLKMKGVRKMDYGNWFQDVSNFYAQLAQTPALVASATLVGITETVVLEQKQKMSNLQALKENQRKANANAQLATKLRNNAFDELQPLYSDYIKYAKVLLPNNQVLEAIGIRVK